MTSVLNVDTIADKAGTGPVALTKQSAAKAWIAFNGTGTIATRNSFGVTSISDNSTGNYTVNFSNSFSAADYAQQTSGDAAASAHFGTASITETYTTSATRGRFFDAAGSGVDTAFANVTTHGDLA
jgi:hypothetical protein